MVFVNGAEANSSSVALERTLRISSNRFHEPEVNELFFSCMHVIVNKTTEDKLYVTNWVSTKLDVIAILWT